MSIVSVLRRFVIAGVAASLLAALPAAPAQAAAEPGGSSGSYDGSGGGTATDPFDVDRTGRYPVNKVVCVTPRTGQATINGTIKAYQYHPLCPPDGAPPSSIVAFVKTCERKIAVWRFYGTIEDPAKSVTMSEINEPDLCLDNDEISFRAYPVNPLDKEGTRLPASRETVWNIQNASNPSKNLAFDHRTQLNGSAGCFKRSNAAIDLYKDSMSGACPLTTGEPVAFAGKSCEAVQPAFGNSLAGWLASGDPEKVRAAQNRLLRNYIELRSVNSPPVAASLAGLAGANARTAPSITGPGSITRLDSLPCSSVVDFVKMPVTANDPQQRRISICFASIREHGFAAAVGRRPQLYEYTWHPGQFRPMFFTQAPAVFSAGGRAAFDGTMISMRQLRLKGPTAAADRALRVKLLSGIRETLQNYDRPVERPGGYYRPAANGMSWEHLLPPDPDVLSVDGAMKTLSDPSWSALDCYSSIVTDGGDAVCTGLACNPGPECTPATCPPPVNPCPSGSCAPPGAGDDGVNVTVSPAGPVRVTVYMPRNLSVRGLYGPYPQTRIVSETLMCGSRPCDRGSNPLDPELLSTVGTLVVRADGPYGTECTNLNAMLENGKSNGCGYVTDTPHRGRLVGQALRMAFFSPTDKGVRIEPIVSGGSGLVQYYKKVDEWRIVSGTNLRTVNGVASWDCPAGTSADGGRYGVNRCRGMFTTYPKDGPPRTVGITVVSSDGQSLKRSVLGSVGGGGN